MFAKKNTEQAAASEKKKETPKYTWQQNLSLYLHDMVYMLAAVMVLLMLFFRVIVVDGPSMENTLLNGDYMLLVSNLFYRDPQPGDVVVAPYTKTLTTLKEGAVFPQTVAPGCVFVMGDNRNNSKDSRSLQIGQVDAREVLGKVICLVFPGTGMGGTQARDFHRIGAVK